MRELDVGQSALLTDIAMCVNHYRLASPGLYCCVHVPVQLDEATRITPGVIAMVNYGEHKQCDPGEHYDYFRGAPNFIVDVFPADHMLDYESRREAFEKAGVIEYVALKDTHPLEWIWNRLEDGKYTELKTSDSETIDSSALPGFWVPTVALKQRDWWTIMSSIDRGVTRKPHHEFMETIWK